MNHLNAFEARRPRRFAYAGAFSLLLGLAGSAVAAPMPTTASAYGQRPLSFEPNQGQTAPEVRFLSRGPGYQLFLTAEEAVLALYKPTLKGENSQPISTPQKNAEKAVVRMHVDGANPNASMSGQSPLPGKVNYLRGNDPKQWRTDIPTYEKVKYTNVYPGIDLVYYGKGRQLEYDFIVAPGADPKAIALTFSGGELQLTEAGELVLATATGEVRFQKPVLYQEIEGRKQPVEGQYVRRGAERIGFEVGAYDATHPLVIDPVLRYSTYLGGSGNDVGYGIAVDSRGQAYVTGRTLSTDFPVTPQAVQPEFTGTPDEFGLGPTEAFVAKLNAAGTALMYSTYLGGGGWDRGRGIAVDFHGQAHIIGSTPSDDFPTTPNALQPAHNGDDDAFVAKLNASGTTLMYSTYLGGSRSDAGNGIALDSHGQAYVVGETISGDFPTTPQAVQPEFTGTPDELGRVPRDAFVAKLNAKGSALVYSTYLGGEGTDEGKDIAVDSRGQAYVVGETISDDFPTTPKAPQSVRAGSFDAFVAKLNAAGNRLVYSTYLGGSDDIELGNSIAVDFRGQAFIAGETLSGDFPTTPQALQPIFGGGPGGGPADAFVTQINAAGTTLVHSTYLGGFGDDRGQGIALDSRGQAYVTGGTFNSPDFPITSQALQPELGGFEDAFVTKITHPRHRRK